jgi:hypothetical protein
VSMSQSVSMMFVLSEGAGGNCHPGKSIAVQAPPSDSLTVSLFIHYQL